MERKSLLLGAVLFAVSISHANQFLDNAKFGFGVGLGSRVVTLGDPTSTTVKNLLGNAKSTSTVASTGTVTRLEHTVPTTVVNAYYTLGITPYSGIKFTAEAHLADSKTHTIYDGQSTTAAVTLKASKPVLTYTASTLGGAGDYDVAGGGNASALTDDASATVGISSITAGKRECKVDHQTAYGFNVKYAVGTESRFAIGIGTLRTKDNYDYVVEEPPAGGSANSGVYNASDSPAFSENFIIGGTAITDNTAITDGTAQTNPTNVVTKNFTPTLGTTSLDKNSRRWTGVVAEAISPINDYVIGYASFGYYKRTFDPTTDATTAAPMIVNATQAKAWTFSAGIGVNKTFDRD